ncbi:uncharacterized protein BDZ99DRAFT_525778 [Mytilinidion resinicola]|uniref:G-patch domain-containing protein n=1 Tax=Mytilinidion resinicola TaxID=574789 RepID=A0A6A6Y6N5_9PEZI|nr:uncharacterized protein BDZ99DRAFT_525778 [Mytilinidion resinicola]KAF2804188.1 hypothetical protein BDZ99DRAFT_525778 [Mytilinidion resinicola]
MPIGEGLQRLESRGVLQEVTSKGADGKRDRLSVSLTPHFPQQTRRSSLTGRITDSSSHPEEQATHSEPSTTLPGKNASAARMMEKIGHVKSKGLGLNQHGITQPLVHKKLGKIAVIKGGARANEAEVGPNRKRSEVVVVFGLLNSVYSGDDEARNDRRLRQEIGDYRANKKVHLYYKGNHTKAPVYLKFANKVYGAAHIQR